MTAEEALYCTILYHAKHVEPGNELLHAVCKCLVEDAERLKESSIKNEFSYETAISAIQKNIKIPVSPEKTEESKIETPVEESTFGPLKQLPDELAM